MSAYVLSPDATSLAAAPQTSVTAQELDGEAIANSNQTSAIEQGESAAAATAGAEPAAADASASASAGAEPESGAATTPAPTDEPQEAP